MSTGRRWCLTPPAKPSGAASGWLQQHFALVGALTALENVMLGAESVGTFGRLDVEATRSRVTVVAREMGVSLPWDKSVDSLGIGDRQRLEIVRTISRNARIIVLDEPTAVLTPGEATLLYASLRRLADGGRAVIVVTHRLDEVREHADVVSVMRRGNLVSTRVLRSSASVALRTVARDIMGEEPPSPLERRVREFGEVRLEVRDLRLARALRGVTLQVRAGEIVGVAGVEGNGQRELVRVLAGLELPDGGRVRAGPVVVVHEDRHEEGLVLAASVRDNLVLGELRSFARFGWVDAAALEREADQRLRGARIGPADLDIAASALSGGNQQKIVVARAVARATGRGAETPKVLVFAQPTRGVDLGAARAIHAEIARCADAGKAVLLLSADLAELRALSDRILVMARGRIAAELAPDASDDRIGSAMLGADGPEAAP